jgi:hypothetical protein
MRFSGGKQAGEDWVSFDNREWDQALSWLDQAGLALYFRHSLKTNSRMGAVPDHVRTGLDRREADNCLRATDAACEIRTLCESFAGSGVRYAVLKGISLIPDYCPDSTLRTQYDHDILLDPASLEHAEAILRTAGYTRRTVTGSQCIVYRPPQQDVRFTGDCEARYSPMLRRPVELHLVLWERSEEKIDINLPGDFLERATLRRCRDFEYVALCDEDCLLFQILHAFRHILRNWCRLSVFLEIAHFLKERASGEAFWERFIKRIDALQWAPEATLVVLSLAGSLFGVPIPQKLQVRLNSHLSPALHLWIEMYGKRAAVSNFSRDKCSLFLHREFVEDAAAWGTIWRRRLFPVRRPHRPPAIVFQRGFSHSGKLWMESVHAFRRLRFHGIAGLRYFCGYPRWFLLRRTRPA